MAHNIVLQQPGTCTRCVQLEQELAQAYHDPAWQINTRQAMERRLTQLTGARAAIVLDVDRMHDANERFGHAGVDWRISRIFRSVRQDDTCIGRWLQGDEVVVICDAAQSGELAIRLLVLFEMYGMSATIAVAVATREGIAQGIVAIDVAKREGRRGTIL